MEITKDDIPVLEGTVYDISDKSEFDNVLADSFISVSTECEQSYEILSSIGEMLKGRLIKHDEKIYRVIDYGIGHGGFIEHKYNLGLGVTRVE